MSEYIERGSLIKHLNQFASEHYNVLVNNLILKEPTANVAPVRRGRWIKKSWLIGTSHFCSICDSNYGIASREIYNYCPNCGAKMDGKE